MPRSTDPARRRAVQLLTPALGADMAEDAVATAAASLGLAEPWSESNLRAVIDAVATQPGLVGITGRVVARRLVKDARPGASDPALAAVAGAPAPPPSSRRGGRSLDTLVGLLAPALGEEKARSVVEEAARTLRIQPPLSLADAMRILEQIAEAPGVVGISARFAKTRLHLLHW